MRSSCAQLAGGEGGVALTAPPAVSLAPPRNGRGPVSGLPEPLRLLYFETEPADAELALLALKRGGITARAEICASREEFLRRIEDGGYDVVLAGFEPGAWSAAGALASLRERDRRLPFLVVSHYHGEEATAEILGLGADEVVWKDRLAVLPDALRRAVRERRLRRDRTRAEIALRSANQVLTALIRCAPLPITVIDEQGIVNVWNPAAEEVLGWSRDEALGHTLADVVGRHSGLVRLLERSLDQGGVIGAETTQERQDGATVDLRIYCSPLTDEEERIHGVVGMLTDVTERNLIIEAFRESKERFQSAFLYAPIGMAIHSLDGRILRVNPAFCRMVGYPEADLLRLRCAELAQADDRQLLAQDPGSSSVQHELRLLHRDGRTVHVQWNSSLVRDAAGKPQYQIGQVVDISESKRAEERIRRYAGDLERSNQDLQHFAYVASHDLQEPLRMVRGFVELLARRYEGKLGDDADEYIHYAVDGATRMQNLIRGLLAYSRVGTQGKSFKEVDTGDALDQALDNLQVTIEENQATVTHDPLPVVTGDDTQLAQLFQNLIGNAIKFRSAEPPKIHITASDKNGVWEIAVTDNGIGFDPQHANRIFQMFQRLHGPTKFPGTGIGLALCKRIVERHGGRIWVDATPGQGSTFFFTLPREAPVTE